MLTTGEYSLAFSRLKSLARSDCWQEKKINRKNILNKLWNNQKGPHSKYFILKYFKIFQNCFKLFWNKIFRIWNPHCGCTLKQLKLKRLAFLKCFQIFLIEFEHFDSVNMPVIRRHSLHWTSKSSTKNCRQAESLKVSS